MERAQRVMITRGQLTEVRLAPLTYARQGRSYWLKEHVKLAQITKRQAEMVNNAWKRLVGLDKSY
jgi:hypothetical protein